MIVLKTAQEKFLNALQAVAGIVERRHTLPILANVLMRKTGENLELTTSDLEIQVRTHAELGVGADLDLEVAGGQLEVLPGLAHQHVGQDRQGVAALDDAGHRLQCVQEFFLCCLQDNHLNLSAWS